jgi:phosphate transport system substrate-binding protein
MSRSLMRTGNALFSLLLVLGVCGGCTPSGKSIQNTGSDTMVNLAQAWAETYHKLHPEVLIQVNGGGSGVGIAALEAGTVDIANASREIKPTEAKTTKEKTGKDPKEFTVGYDALAIYVHKDNPIDTISLEELAQIYGQNGQTTKWSQLGIQNKLCQNDEIIRVSRQSSSGTWMYFREAILGEKGEYKQGSRDMNGSKDVVELVANTPCAIGYSGMGYKTDNVKWLKISKKKGEPGVAPSKAAALDKTYPIARKLYMYTVGEPSGETRTYIDWVLSDEGQKVVDEMGYVPLPKGNRAP